MAEFYKLRIALWNTGTDKLTLEQEAAYLRVVNAINLYDHALSYELRVLAGLWRCSERRAKRLLGELVDTGKLAIEDGWIVNKLAMDDVSTRARRRVDALSAGRLGGIESGKVRRNVLKIKTLDEAIASTREEKRREEKKEYIGRANALPPSDDASEPCVEGGFIGPSSKPKTATPKPKRSSQPDSDQGFELFWNEVYPHPDGKTRKADARKHWNRAVDSGVAPEHILSKAAHHAEHVRLSGKEAYAGRAANWLSGQRWEDEPELPKPDRRTENAGHRAQAGLEIALGYSLPDYQSASNPRLVGEEDTRFPRNVPEP